MLLCLVALALPARSLAQKLWDGQANDLEWTNNVNWGVLNNPDENIQPGPDDTCNFTGTAPSQTNIYVSADTTVQRIQLRNNSTSSRTIRVGTNVTADVTLGLSGTAATLLANQRSAAGYNLAFSGVTNDFGARLKLRIDLTKQIDVVHAASFITITCDLIGNAGFSKTSPGTLVLGGNNSYFGTTTVSAGTVRLDHPNGLGFGGGDTVVVAGAVLDLNGQTGVNEILTLNGTGIGSGGALINSSANPASLDGGLISSVNVTSGGSGYSSPPTVSFSGGGGSGAAAEALLGLTDASITVDNGGSGYDLPPYVIITGGGGSGATAVAILTGDVVTSITVTSPGWGYTSAPTITLIPQSAGSGATASANANNFTVSGVRVTAAGSGYISAPTVSFSGGGGSGAAASVNFASVTLASDSSIGGTGNITIGSPIGGSGGLTKVGANTLLLTGANTYSGATVVDAGALLVNSPGSLASASAVTVNNGATLGGNGSIGGSVSISPGATLSPGASVGTLSIGGDLTLAGDVFIEINKTLSPASDRVNVTGTITHTGGGTLTVTNLGPALTTGDSFQIFNQPVANGESILINGGDVTWTNKLAVDGSIAVLSAGAPPPVPATNLTIQAVGPASFALGGQGAANSAYYVYASTNITLPMSSWWLIGVTNSDAGGLIQFVDIAATNAQRFYRFGQPAP
jgi:autotransporter-associated beta strand protein